MLFNGLICSKQSCSVTVPPSTVIMFFSYVNGNFDL